MSEKSACNRDEISFGSIEIPMMVELLKEKHPSIFLM